MEGGSRTRNKIHHVTVVKIRSKEAMELKHAVLGLVEGILGQASAGVKVTGGGVCVKEVVGDYFINFRVIDVGGWRDYEANLVNVMYGGFLDVGGDRE